MNKISIDQWVAFQAVIDEGSFFKAAQKLHKSQSSISYNITKLQDCLNLQLFKQQGRKAVLTEQGERILKLSRQVTKAAAHVEAIATNYHQNYEQEITLAIDEIFPPQLLLKTLTEFADENNQTRLTLSHGILSGPSDMLINGEAELAIVSRVPEGYLGEKLLNINFLPYAHVNSSLHDKILSHDDLYSERYIIAKDTGSMNKRDEGWLGSDFFWKVSSIEMKIQCVVNGLGFAWLPEEQLSHRNLPIKTIHIEGGNIRSYPLYIVHRNTDEMGSAAKDLIRIFLKNCEQNKEASAIDKPL